MPYTYSPHIISDARAQEAAELSLIEHDLDHVIECCRLRLALDLSVPSNMTLMRALSTSALITYRRCFGDGRRIHLSKDDLACLTASEMSEHEHFLHLASWAHAHPVAANENGVVGISIGKDGAGGFRRAGLQYSAATTFDLGGSTDLLLRLCKRVRDDVAKPKRKFLEQSLLEWLQDFEDKELANWPSSLSAIVLNDDPKKARKKRNDRAR